MSFIPTTSLLATSALLNALPVLPANPSIAGIPATVFGNIVSGVVGSVITLCGVLLSNWHNRGLKRSELTHDAEQRNREREMALRREVFLPAVEAALSMQSSIGALSDLGTPVSMISERFQSSSAAFAKVAAVGTQETVAACQLLSNGLGAAFFDLSIRRGALQHYQNRLAEIDRYMTVHEGLRDSWIKIQQDLVARGEKNAEIWTAAQGHFTHHVNEITKALAERGNVIRDRDSKHLEAFETLVATLEKLSPLFPPALFAMRREMQLPLDEQAFLDQYSNFRSQQIAIFKDSLEAAKLSSLQTAQPATTAKIEN